MSRADANIARMMRAVKDIVLSDTDADIQKFVDEVDDTEKKVLEDLAIAKERFLGDKSDFDVLIAKFKEWKPIRDDVIAQKRAGKTQEAKQITRTTGGAKLAEIAEQRKKVYDWAWKKAEGFQKNAGEVRQFSMQLTLGIGLLVVLSGVAIGIMFTRCS